MSKAFTRESDEDQEEQSFLTRAAALLPPGVKNYVTKSGARSWELELQDLLTVQRPAAALQAEKTGDKLSLQKLDQRIVWLQDSLHSAEVVDTSASPLDQVRFGAQVTVREKDGSVVDYRLVGVDEMDLDQNWISWRSPLAKALLNAKVGQKVKFKSPAGEQTLEILKVEFPQ
jgi:transcription elongation factor GreB